MAENLIWLKNNHNEKDGDYNATENNDENDDNGYDGYHDIQSKKTHDDVIKWKHLPRYWHFVRGIHRSPANSPHKGQWRGALMFFFVCAWINGWVNNRGAGDLRRHRAHYDDIVMINTCLTMTVNTMLLPGTHTYCKPLQDRWPGMKIYMCIK